MFDLSKYALNDILKDYTGKGKKPIVITAKIDDLHPDYVIKTRTEITVIKKRKDKKVPNKKGGFAKWIGSKTH